MERCRARTTQKPAKYVHDSPGGFWFELPFTTPIPHVFNDQVVDTENTHLRHEEKDLSLTYAWERVLSGVKRVGRSKCESTSNEAHGHAEGEARHRLARNSNIFCYLRDVNVPSCWVDFRYVEASNNSPSGIVVATSYDEIIDRADNRRNLAGSDSQCKEDHGKSDGRTRNNVSSQKPDPLLSLLRQLVLSSQAQRRHPVNVNDPYHGNTEGAQEVKEE
mmetsp:Transcript_56531/g.111689  ORF Transcript_56531/g.111689 Transcript_56531/m.111689 type:complete len:219 (-) Transcript_56531:739-1395(-)